MTAGLTDAEARELAMLRRRAYGPGADLDDAGEQRLRALEERALGRAPEASERGGDGSAPSTDPQGETPGEPAPDPRVRRAVALGAALATAGLLVGAGYALGRLPTTDASYLSRADTDAGELGVLLGAPAFVSRALDPATVVPYERIGDDTFWSASRADGLTCLLLTAPIDGIELSSQDGVYQTTCAPGDLAPSMDWMVMTAFPSPPGMPAGSILRVTLDGDRLRLERGVSP